MQQLLMNPFGDPLGLLTPDNGVMKVPAHATGFGRPAGAPDVIDFRDLQRACHAAARAVGGTVIAAAPASVTPIFHSVVVDVRGERVAVLGHTSAPFVAFAEPLPPGDCELAFVDRPDLADILAASLDVQICAASDLAVELSSADLTDLAAVERKQIAYWKPATVGEAIFNFWD